jgi:aerobic carbon-monoxide dehydrogenase small subunit
LSRHSITLTVNEQDYPVEVEARHTLLDALRDGCGLTGTHAGCEHGVCGACTVLLDGAPVRACLLFAEQAAGRSVRTVEGLAAPDGTPHPLQAQFMAHHALQCGFCTPGFLMLAAGLIEADPDVGEAEIRDALASNLCRCTGYEAIVAAVCSAAAQARQA